MRKKGRRVSVFLNLLPCWCCCCHYSSLACVFSVQTSSFSLRFSLSQSSPHFPCSFSSFLRSSRPPLLWWKKWMKLGGTIYVIVFPNTYLELPFFDLCVRIGTNGIVIKQQNVDMCACKLMITSLRITVTEEIYWYFRQKPDEWHTFKLYKNDSIDRHYYVAI